MSVSTTDRQEKRGGRVFPVFEEHETSLLEAWLALQPDVESLRADLVGLRERWDTSVRFIRALRGVLEAPEGFAEGPWEEVHGLSTPVVEVWTGILALPVIGVLDSLRTQQVMEALLAKIVESQADYAIVDITGVPAVDSVTAHHLVKTATAARFMGARCLISGIRPQIAQTMVTLGLDFGELQTHATLAGALAWALEQKGVRVEGSGARR